MAKHENSPLPDLYAEWMMDFLGGPLPVEVRATCNDCQMYKAREIPCKSDVVFHPNTKCCTFFPELPNFLVGAVLADSSEETARGKEFFERGAIARGVINPLGIFPTAEYSMSYGFNKDNFGQRESLKCPYYMAEEGGLCAIWKYRNGRCSTWFCKHERGTISVVFWKYLDRLLAAVERSISLWCLQKIDLGLRALTELIPASGAPIPGAKSVWGKYEGQEREFFISCAKAVRQLSWKDVLEIAGPETHVLARLVQDAFGKYNNPSVPPRLKCGAWKAERCGPSTMRVWTYSPFDPLELDTALLNALSYFDGRRSTAEALGCIQANPNLQLDSALLQKLCGVRILVEEEIDGAGAAPLNR